ncbi:MAG: phosphoribosyl-AMP cyclohydrolase [Candidatus Bathyarchaeia archaeon]
MKAVDVDSLDFRRNSLIPVVVQEYGTKDVLMLAYTNREALEKTIETGYAHYWSRSRNRLWMKGETSGNTQRVRRILVDCDHDTILLMVEQKGNACHTGEKTCFHSELLAKEPRS